MMKNPWPDPWTQQGESTSDVDSSSAEIDWDFMHDNRFDNLDRSSLFSPQQESRLRRYSLPQQTSSLTDPQHQLQHLQQQQHHQVQHDHSFDQSQFLPKASQFSPAYQSTFGSFHPQQFSPQMHPQQQDHYAHRREYHPVKRAPPVDMIEVGSKVQIVVELPGLKRENLKIDIHDKSQFLTLKGRYERDEYGEEANFLMNERTHGKFRRRIRLPQYADIDHVQANMKDGLLIIEMPSLKKHELLKKKRVISVEGLHPSEDLNTFSKARRFEWADQDRTQVSTATDATVHHHVK